MTRPSDPRARRTRRAVLQQGAGVLIVIFLVGFMVSKPFIEERLKQHGESALAAAGIDGALDFTFQDARMLCSDRLADPAAARRVVLGVDGVHDVTFDRVCFDGTGEPTTTTVAPSTTPAPSTVPATEAPTTTSPPTTAPAATTTVPEPDVAIGLVDGVLTLEGTVASEEQRGALLTAARAVLDPTNVVDRLAVDVAAPLGDETVSELAQLLAVVTVPLAGASITVDGAAVTVEGLAVDRAALTQVDDAVRNVGATADLALRPRATADQAATVQSDLNAVVGAQPLQFGKGATEVTPGMAATLQRLAGIAKRYDGVVVEVQGHTDSEGDPARNQTLSERRAAAVAAALEALGVPPAQLTSRGFGETQLITDNNGAEIPDLSRRVVFAVRSA